MTLNDETLVDLNGLTAEVIAAYVANNSVPASDIASLISAVHMAFSQLGSSEAEPAPVAQKPAVPIRKSVTDDFIICLEDGKSFKSLRRHLSANFGMSPSEYREKWSLPADYPMVAPAYAAKRSELAKKFGLGSKRKKVSGVLPPAPASTGRGRKRTLANA